MAGAFSDKSEYAFSTWLYEKLPLRDALKEIAAHGFSSVDLQGQGVHFDPRIGIERPLIRQWLKEFNLKVHSAHAPFCGFNEEGDINEAIKNLQALIFRTLDDCSELSIPILVVHPIYDKTSIMRDYLVSICEYALKRGVMIALENLWGSYGKNEIKCSLQDDVNNFPGIGLKYCLDIGHAICMKNDIFKEIDAAGKDLITYHIHNNYGKNDDHNLPNEGVIDCQAVYSYARNKGFTGQFTLELGNTPDPYLVMDKVDKLFL